MPSKPTPPSGWASHEPRTLLQEVDYQRARADAAEAALAGKQTELFRMSDVLTATQEQCERHQQDARARADKAEAALADLPEYITRWLMGEGMTIVHRWMTTGWRETMYDEGTAIWTSVIEEAVK